MAIQLPVAEDRITILVAETLGKRDVMTREIVLSMLVPGLLLTLVALGLLRKGIRAGLFKPLTLEEIETIVDLLLADLNKRLADRRVTVTLDDPAAPLPLGTPADLTISLRS